MSSDADCAQVVAMQFAGGRSIAQLTEEWERDALWVEEAIRRALLEAIPLRDGGLKAPRSEVRAERNCEIEAVRDAQGMIVWPEK